MVLEGEVRVACIFALSSLSVGIFIAQTGVDFPDISQKVILFFLFFLHLSAHSRLFVSGIVSAVLLVIFDDLDISLDVIDYVYTVFAGS